MGSHATAMLGYGVLLDDALVNKLSASKGYFEIEDLLAERSGLVEPKRTDKEAYSMYQKKIKELEDNCPAEICSIGDHETQIYALVLKGSVLSASERYPKIINFQKFQIEETKLVEFQEFCKQFKINGKSNWILMSRYD